MKRFYLLLASSLVAWGLRAQQQPLYSQFMFNQLAFNPAYAGSEPARLTAVYRNQWMGFEGAPKTLSVWYSAPAFNKRFGYGVNVLHHSIGIQQLTGIEGSYAWRTPLYYGTFALGIQFSLRQLTQNWADPRLVPPSNLPDNALAGELLRKVVPDAGFGLYYSVPKLLYAGIAVTQLMRQNIDFADLNGELSRNARHFNFMAGYHFRFDNQLTITPQAQLRYVAGAPFDADFNLAALINERIYGAVGYRLGGQRGSFGESIVTQIGFRADRLFFCLAYDITLSNLRHYSNGSVEANVSWRFGDEEIDASDIRLPSF